jgi:hypothetical protein
VPIDVAATASYRARAGQTASSPLSSCRSSRRDALALAQYDREGHFLEERISQSIIFDLRGHVFDRLLHQSVGLYTTNRAGEVISRIGNDVDPDGPSSIHQVASRRRCPHAARSMWGSRDRAGGAASGYALLAAEPGWFRPVS